MKTPQPQPKIEFGKCPICDKKIMEQKENQAIKLKDYSDFWIAFSTGEKMKTAICQSCKKTLTKKQAESILEAHKTFWQKGIQNLLNEKISELQKQKDQHLNYYKNLSLASWSLKEKDL